MSIAEAGTHANTLGIRSARKAGGDHYSEVIRKKGDMTKEGRIRRIKKREALVDRLMGLAYGNS